MSFLALLNDICDNEGETAIKESLDRHKRYKLEYNSLLGEYTTLINMEIIDINKVKEVMGKLGDCLKLIGKSNINEIEEGFLLTEMKGYIISLDDGAYQDKVKEIAGDMWELKVLELHKKINKLVAIFERPYFWQHANIIDD